jgi:acyl-homoserine lactone synthase
VITSENKHLYRDEIEQHHRLRHEIFVGERGWIGLERPDGRDVDAYDDEHSVYLLAIDAGRVVGGQRLRPTTRPHMLADIFSHLAQRGLPSRPDVLEWTRYFVVRERRFGRTDWRLLAAVQDYCLDEGISELTAVVEMWWLPRWQQAGFRTRPLGLPQLVEGQPTLAVSIDVSPSTLELVKRRSGLGDAKLVRRGLATETGARRWYPATLTVREESLSAGYSGRGLK